LNVTHQKGGNGQQVKDCKVCGQPGQQLLDGVSGDHEICKAITGLRLDVLSLEARFVDWRWRQANATRQLLDKTAALEDDSLAELGDIDDPNLESRCNRWAHRHNKKDVDNMVRVLQRLGYGWTSKREGDTY
jgi:hypothetical protein